MSVMNEKHKPVCGQAGACSVPMYIAGSPAGFCDEKSYGEQYTGAHLPWRYQLPNHPPLALGYCCEGHGGPSEEKIRFVRDGSKWCCFGPSFKNLQESVAGFGDTQTKAMLDYEQNIDAELVKTKSLLRHIQKAPPSDTGGA